MYPLFLASLFFALVSMYSVQSIPVQEIRLTQSKAGVEATNFMAYRRAVVNYVRDNPSATGSVDDASLASYWLPGYVRDDNWSNVVSGSTVFIFATDAVEKTTRYRIFEMNGNSLLIGHKSPSTGMLISMNGTDSGVAVPGAIPANAFVMMGN